MSKESGRLPDGWRFAIVTIPRDRELEATADVSEVRWLYNAISVALTVCEISNEDVAVAVVASDGWNGYISWTGAIHSHNGQLRLCSIEPEQMDSGVYMDVVLCGVQAVAKATQGNAAGNPPAGATISGQTAGK